MVPLVVWPSKKRALDEHLARECLRQLPLSTATPCAEGGGDRPHCPDLARLAKARQGLAKALQEPNPQALDPRALTILVDHPDHRPPFAQPLISP